MHPAHRLCSWLLAVIAVQNVAGWPLALAFAIPPLFGAAVIRRWWRLLKRARWLLLSLFVVLGWGIAGDPVVDAGGALVPTVEGLTAAATQLGRLALVLAAVAALLETTPLDRLMAGCHALLRPLAALGADIDRAVVRLALALHYAERMRGRDWRSMLEPGVENDAPAAVSLALPAANVADWSMLAAALLFCTLALVS